MATAFSPSNSVTTTTAANFIPEIWSDEIVAAYKKNLVLANLVMKMNFKDGIVVHLLPSQIVSPQILIVCPQPTMGIEIVQGSIVQCHVGGP